MASRSRDVEPLTNGHAPAPEVIASRSDEVIASRSDEVARAALVPLRRTDWWVDLPEDEYPGFRFRMWKNYPTHLLDDIRRASEDTPRAMAALKAIVLEHNGWGDFDGNLLPQPERDEFWDRITVEQIALLVQLIQTEAGKLPNFPARTRRN